jgi:hypothetical protein
MHVFLKLAFLLLTAVLPATASHFRYGHLSYRKLSATRVEMTVSTAWRVDKIGGVTIRWGDGRSSGIKSSAWTDRTTFTDASGKHYMLVKKVVEHEYSSSTGTYEASFESCCRIHDLVNDKKGDYRVAASVNLNDPHSPKASTPPILQMLASTNNDLNIRPFINDLNNDEITCAYAQAGKGISGQPKVGSHVLTVTNDCKLQWNLLSYSTTNTKFSVSMVITATGVTATGKAYVSKVPLDFIIEIGSAPDIPLTCNAVSPVQFTVQEGETISARFTVAGGDKAGTYVHQVTTASEALPGATISSPTPSTLLLPAEWRFDYKVPKGATDSQTLIQWSLLSMTCFQSITVSICNDDDKDGVCNPYDKCPNNDDRVDTDRDNIPDGCDNCPSIANTDQIDSDSDGVGDVCKDTDGDEILDAMDNCPEVSNPNQEDNYGSTDVGDACEDTDGDEILDAIDNCPEDSNPDQANNYGSTDVGDACEDTDGDEILDAIDNCPEVSNPDQEDNYGSTDVGDDCEDTDGDEILDVIDNCPVVSNPNQEDNYGSTGVGDACEDTDGDEILDAIDNCPEVSNPDQEDNYGSTDVGDDCEDTDGDEILDAIDNCPVVSNPNQEDNYGSTDVGDACEDTDGDEILDAIDNCPEVSNPDQEDNYGSTDVGDDCEDTDGDEILDAIDNCPEVSNPDQEDNYGSTDVGDVCEDTDGDKIIDVIDNCPEVSNPTQEDNYGSTVTGDACEDTDGDEILDAMDNCPEVSNPNQEDNYGSTVVGDACEDTDGDEILDAIDNCPLVSNTDQANNYGTVAGDACEGSDSDSDGIPDAIDNCPEVFNPNQEDIDGDKVGDHCDKSGPCIADEAWDNYDDGCNPIFPYCAYDDYSEIPASLNGTRCTKCFNHFDDLTYKDTGCTDDARFCLADHNYHGDECTGIDKVCWNTAGGPDGVDLGCSVNDPFCVGEFYQEVDASLSGEFCVLCVDTQLSDEHVGDWGCYGATPRCVIENDGTSPGVWKGGDLCAPLIAAHVECIKNGPWNGGIDEGCTTDPDKKVCVMADGVTLPAWGEGSTCVKCVNTRTYEDNKYWADEGCDGTKRRCVDDYGNDPGISYAGTQCND